jgi:hypothetical protein
MRAKTNFFIRGLLWSESFVAGPYAMGVPTSLKNYKYLIILNLNICEIDVYDRNWRFSPL